VVLRPEGTVSLGHVGDSRAYIGDGTPFLQVTDDHTLAMDKAMADGCSRAWMITGDDRWIERVERAARWFVGDNDVGVVLYDRKPGDAGMGLPPRSRTAWATRRLSTSQRNGHAQRRRGEDSRRSEHSPNSARTWRLRTRPPVGQPGRSA
jgi:hypothetical protein